MGKMHLDTTARRASLAGMQSKRPIDATGASLLIGFATLLAFNQVVMKVTSDGIQPVFQAGLRSVGAVFVLLAWARFKGIGLAIPRAAWGGAFLLGLLFAVEFLCLFKALDIGKVGRVSVTFYTMPVWLALALHLLVPEERLTPKRMLGLALAVLGVAIALLDRSDAATSLGGDLLALLAAMSWAGIALVIRMSEAGKVPPVVQLIFQVAISAPILMLAAPFFGPFLRDPQPLHWAGLGFQIVFIASFGFLLWFWLMTVYSANGVASFSFLSPVLAVLLGWLILGEQLAPAIWVALALVASGIFLINRR